MKRRTAVKWLLAVVFSALAVGVGWRFWPRERLLLERATLVARTEDWHLGERFNYGLDVHWLSDNEILFTRFEGPQQKQRVAYRRNIHTGSERQLPDLTKALDEFGGEVVDAEAVSPDGKWLLRSDRWGPCLLAEIEGKRRFEFESKRDDCYRSLYWTADSRYWLENYAFSDESQAIWLHELQNPKAARSLAIAGNEQRIGGIQRLISRQKAIAIVPPDISRGSNTATVYVLSLEGGVKVLQQHQSVVPASSEDYQCEVSPDGDRLAWQVTVRYFDSRPVWLKRLLSFLPDRSYQTTGLWVSNIDGSQMREIAHIVEPLAGADVLYSVWQLQWLPGGKRLSFEHNNGLWTVPID